MSFEHNERNIAQIQYEKKIHCLCQQLQEFQKQVENLQDELERTRSRLVTSCREQDDLKRQMSQKDDAISCYESKIEDLTFEMKERDKNSQKTIECLQQKVCSYHDQLQEKEAALFMCRNEVKTHIACMEEIKADFNNELQQRDIITKQMKEDLRRVYEDLKCRSDESCMLERTIVDFKSRLHQCCCQLKEADSRVACLQEKIQLLECQHSKERQCAQDELMESERKYSNCCNDLCACQNEIRKMKRCIQDKDEEIQALTSERNCMARELQNAKQEMCILQDRISCLENDNKEICRLLQQKVKCIKELECQLCIKEQEQEQCQCCIEELNSKIRALNTSTSGFDVLGEKEDKADLSQQLKQCKEKCKKLEQEVEDLKKKLEWAVQEMENMAKEIKRLNCELDCARREICEKESMIGDLERTIEHAEHDMECRMKRVDEQLQKYEREIKEKTHMIADCEEKCCRYQHALCDKEHELENTEQKLARCNCELSNLCCKTKELEEARNCIQNRFNEMRVQYSELCEEYKITREQLQCQTVESNDAKRDLACAQREVEKLRRELDDVKMCLQEKEGQIFRLNEDKTCLASKVSSLQCRLEGETTQMTQQMADMKYHMEKENEQLRNCLIELEENNATLTQKNNALQRQLCQIEKCYYQKVETLSRENEMLQTKAADKEDQLQAAKDCITLKDSEIMRLKLRMCNIDRCNNMTSECCVPMPGSHALTCETGVKCRRRSASCCINSQSNNCNKWSVSTNEPEDKD
ncbi:coiled-coil domain-containing protein 18 [Biomphalaria pfeifferi]|uniref:Coiled-coil domain-containing protein 18 n=1 Tax=Biomphalaria pfeifferi TaxID=112525 RepID=A0AAD8FH16_BIOPF|nr:coiled-coil domain-containing protein 18 [Biomphalaria pfeifferi]